MKPFNVKDTKTQKWFLVSGLLLALGFNLSWNPENTHIARHESKMNSFEMASEEFQKFNLQDVNATNCNASVKFALDHNTSGDKQEVLFTVEGDVCVDCEKSARVVIGKNNLTDNLNVIQMIIEEKAKALCNKSDVASEDEGGDMKKKGKVGKITDEACEDLELEDGLVECQSSQLTAMTDSCEDIPKKADQKLCYKKAETYYKKFLAPSMVKALSTGRNSEIYQEAAFERDMLIETLPGKFDDSIRSSLTAATAAGVYMRSQTFYNKCLSSQSCSQNTPGGAAMQTLNFFNTETQASGSSLYNSLRNWSFESENGEAMASLYQNSYSNPLQTQYFNWGKNMQNGLDFNTDMFSQAGSGDSNMPELQFGLNAGTEAVPDARGNLRSTQPSQPYESFGDLNAAGSPALLNMLNPTASGAINMRAPNGI